jgi:putative membrane protein
MIRSAAAIVAFGLSAAAFAADPSTLQSAGPVKPTATFVTAAAVGNFFEIESSKLALDRSKSSAVKAVAQRMVDDHSKAAVKLKESVAATKLTMPPDKLDARHQALYDELREKGAGDFDKAFIEAQYEAHVEAVDLFKAYAKGGENDRMRALAAELLPTLEAHLEHVRKMR